MTLIPISAYPNVHQPYSNLLTTTYPHPLPFPPQPTVQPSQQANPYPQPPCNNTIQTPIFPQTLSGPFQNPTMPLSPPTFTTLTAVPTYFSKTPSNPLPSPPELQDTDGNLFSRQGTTTQLIHYWNQNMNQGNML